MSFIAKPGAVVLSPSAFRGVVAAAPGSPKVTLDHAQRLQQNAEREFRSQTQGETRAGSVSPPRYADSWEIQSVAAGGTRLSNTARHAQWVESGAHPGGGPTQTLAYRPIRRAIDSMTIDYY
jgi:hypothetical protein